MDVLGDREDAPPARCCDATARGRRPAGRGLVRPHRAGAAARSVRWGRSSPSWSPCWSSCAPAPPPRRSAWNAPPGRRSTASARPPRAAAEALAAIEAPLLALARQLEDVLDDEADTLESGERARIEGALRGLDRRARMTLPAWRSMLTAIDEDAEDDPDFVDWFDAAFLYGRVVDAACRRHWVDPTEPLTAAVIAPAHGVLVTSATLADSTLADPFALAEMRTGAARLPERPKTLRLASPFDYARNARALVVTDVGRDDPRQVAAAMRELFLAAGGGGLGLFTAIRRLRPCTSASPRPWPTAASPSTPSTSTRWRSAPWSTSSAPRRTSCLLGTDAVRDGVDVPGRSLRLLVFDRVPWPRPDILHKARRGRFGGKAYDDVGRARPDRPGVRPADPPRRRPGRVRHARRRRPDPAVLRPARGRRRLERRGPGRGHRGRRAAPESCGVAETLNRWCTSVVWYERWRLDERSDHGLPITRTHRRLLRGASCRRPGFRLGSRLRCRAPLGRTARPGPRCCPTPRAPGLIHAAIDIAAPPQTVWAVMTDCRLAARLVASVTSCTILQADPRGGWDVREQVTRGGLFSPAIRNVFRSDYQPYSLIRFHRVWPAISNRRKANGGWRAAA